MTEFQVGDIVRRVEGVNHDCSGNAWAAGEIRTVASVRGADECWVDVEGFDGGNRADRLELVHRPASLEWDPSLWTSPRAPHLYGPASTVAAELCAVWCLLNMAPRIRWTLEPIKPETVTIELPTEAVKRFANWWAGQPEIGVVYRQLGDACRAALEALEP